MVRLRAGVQGAHSAAGEQLVGYVVCQPAVHQVYIYSRCTQVGDVVRPATCLQGIHSAASVQVFKVYIRLVM